MAMSKSRAGSPVGRLLTRAFDRPGPIGDPTGKAERGMMASAMAMVARGLADGGAGLSPRRTPPGDRHPMAPSAIRVERGRGRIGSGRSEQTAVTLWFGGDGPALPGPVSGGSPALRAMARIGAGALAAAALAAATTIAARVDEPRIVDVAPDTARPSD